MKIRLTEEATARLKAQSQAWPIPQKAKAFAQGDIRLTAVLRHCPRRMWSFTLKKTHWTIAQVLWHLADQEANLYVRLRLAAAQPGSFVSSYDQEIWADRLAYPKAPAEQARDLILLLRKANSDLLARIPRRAWKGKVEHPEWGTKDLEYMVALNIWHLEHHLRQMERRLREWKAGK
ncbi:MAG TPA: DinB family protein [bacterium]|nr:DinB family protein [bacterium]